MGVHIITLSFAALLIGLHGCSYFVKDLNNMISLVPANTLVANSYLWNLFSSCFFEVHVLRVTYDLAILLAINQNISFMALDQFGLYLVFNVLTATMGISAWVFLRFFMTSEDHYLTGSIYGFGGILISLMMFARQQLGNKLVVPSITNITYHHLPTIFLALHTILYLFSVKLLTSDYCFVLINYFSSWTYLRFYYTFPNSDGIGFTNGDSSEQFAFIAMFPEILQPVVLPLTIAVYNLLSIVGIFPKLQLVDSKLSHHLRFHQDTSPTTQGSDPTANNNTTAVLDAKAERRRAKAIKLLDARLVQLSSVEPESWGENKDGSSNSNANMVDLKV